MRYGLFLGCCAVMMLIGSGCASRRVQPTPLTVVPQRYGDAFDAAVDTLRDGGFTVARQDYRFGLITTQPLEAPTALEPWRGGNATAAQALRATVNDVRRTARVTLRPQSDAASDMSDTQDDAPASTRPVVDPGDFAIAPAPLLPNVDPQRFAVDIEVLMERKQLPGQRIAGSGRSNIFSPLSDTPAELAARGVARTYWEPIGRDPYLERRLARAIERRLSASSSFK